MSGLAAIQRRVSVFTDSMATLPLKPTFLFKHQTLRRSPPPISFPTFSDSSLCPKFYVQLYIDSTDATDDSDALFLHPVSSRSLDTSRLRYWMVQAIRLAQDRRTVVRPHELRKLAYSANWARRTDLSSLLQHGFWASAHPFLRHYLVDLPGALPHFVAAGSSVSIASQPCSTFIVHCVYCVYAFNCSLF